MCSFPFNDEAAWESQFGVNSPFYRALSTKYDPNREDEAIQILTQHREIACLMWPGPDQQGQPFVRGSTVLHYAANDGKLKLMVGLFEVGADVNSSEAEWYRSVLSWAANNAQLKAILWLLEKGAKPVSLDALHAAAWGGSSRGADPSKDYVAALALLIGAGADMNDRRHRNQLTPLGVALESGNLRAIDFLRAIGAKEP